MVERTSSKANKLIILAVAAGFILIGLLILFLPKLKHLGCTEAVEATVIQVNSQKKTGHLKNEWPTYEYTYSGVTIRYESEFRGNDAGYSIGDTETIYINPEDPEEVYEPNNKSNLKIAYIMIGAGMLCLIVFFIGLFKKND